MTKKEKLKFYLFIFTIFAIPGAIAWLFTIENKDVGLLIFIFIYLGVLFLIHHYWSKMLFYRERYIKLLYGADVGLKTFRDFPGFDFHELSKFEQIIIRGYEEELREKQEKLQKLLQEHEEDKEKERKRAELNWKKYIETENKLNL